MEFELDKKRLELNIVHANEVKQTKIVTRDQTTPSSIVLYSTSRIRVAVALFARTLMPAVLKLCRIYLRNQQTLLATVRHHLLPALVAFLANSYGRRRPRRPQRALAPPSCAPPEKSVECQVLYAPPSGPVLADVIFIHGLHGGVDRTWKQGQWRHDGHKLRDQTPVAREATGNLHVPARKRSLKRALNGICRKRAGGDGKVARRNGEHCAMREEGEWEMLEDLGELVEGMHSGCWPQDWIPKDCPGARVIALNYTTDLLWAPVWKKKRQRTDMVARSDEMIEALIDLRVGSQPIVWVGHSKGGLYIKQIILNVWERHRDKHEIFNIFEKTKGIMFYSVPHKGSSLADFTLPLLRRSVELIEVQRNCDFVLDLHKRFLDICNRRLLDAEIFSFIETSFTLMSFVFLKIVAYESADPDIGVKCDVPLDHREICKPAGRDCFLYLELIKLIKKYMSYQET